MGNEIDRCDHCGNETDLVLVRVEGDESMMCGKCYQGLARCRCGEVKQVDDGRPCFYCELAEVET